MIMHVLCFTMGKAYKWGAPKLRSPSPTLHFGNATHPKAFHTHKTKDEKWIKHLRPWLDNGYVDHHIATLLACEGTLCLLFN
jgi:hypothetical protein